MKRPPPKRIKKRYVVAVLSLFFIVIVFGLSRLEIIKFRKDPITIRASVAATTNYEGVSKKISYQEDKSVHYFQVGNQENPALFLIHGSPGSYSAYLRYFQDEDLLSKYQIIAVDRPGFGYSHFGKAEPSLGEQAKALFSVWRDLGLDSAVWLGHSFGAPVICKLAVLFPESVKALVLAAPSIDPDLEPREWWRAPLNSGLVRWILPPALRVSNQEIAPLYQELEILKKEWHTLTPPIWVVQGEQDQLVPKENVDFARKQLPHNPPRVIMFPGSDHFIIWSQFDSIKTLLLDLDSNK